MKLNNVFLSMSLFLFSSTILGEVVLQSDKRPMIDLSLRKHIASPKEDLEEIKFRQNNYKMPANAVEMQAGLVPVYDIKDASELKNADFRKEIYDVFFDGPGALILRGVFKKETMDEYNLWCEEYLAKPSNAKNRTHPKQKDKFVINDLLELLSKDNPKLLMDMINNPVYTGVPDILLGFSTIGAFTTHWIKPFGAGQERHTDYPLHVGSGAFWENSVEKMERMTTQYQIDKIFPYITLQTLIATDAMDKENGSTEVWPHSHHISLLDVKVHDPCFKEAMKEQLINVELAQGDVLVFNRGLYHAGGSNKTNKRRNSAIMQSVMLFAVGQHKHNTELILENLEASGVFDAMSSDEVKDFKLRIEKPYPLDTTVVN